MRRASMGKPQFSVCAVVIAALCTPAAAQTASELSAEDWMRARVGGHANHTAAQALKSLQLQFFNADVDGGGITAKDAEILEKVQRAQQRAHMASQFLSRDLDGDGKVTRSELETVFSQQAARPLNSGGVQIAPTPGQMREILDRLIAEAMRADANNNGVLDFEELYKEDPGQVRSRRLSFRSQDLPKSFDADKDGVITISEYEAVANRIIGEVDTDKNGTISEDESSAFAKQAEAARRASMEAERARAQEAEMADRLKTCSLPKPARSSS